MPIFQVELQGSLVIELTTRSGCIDLHGFVSSDDGIGESTDA
jgi:hypothetical protein